jgi:hypothetical protein
MLTLASLGDTATTVACGVDGIPSLSANAVLAQRNRVPPTGASLSHWAQFVFSSPFRVGEPVRFTENQQLLRHTLAPEAFGHPWRWRFGDGATAVGYTVTHTYKRVGTYTLIVLAYYPSTPAWYELDDALVGVTPAHHQGAA